MPLWAAAALGRTLDVASDGLRPRLRAPKAATAALAGLALAAAGGAHANEIDGLRSFNLEVYGHLDQHCQVGTIDDVDFGDLTVPGKRRESRLALDCNVPISVKISAAHGALANDRHPDGQGPYAGAVPYSLDVRMPVRRPERDVIAKSFESRDLAGGGQTFDTGDGIAVDGMRLRVGLGQPVGEAGLLAGRYSEVIEITVTPS